METNDVSSRFVTGAFFFPLPPPPPRPTISKPGIEQAQESNFDRKRNTRKKSLWYPRAEYIRLAMYSIWRYYLAEYSFERCSLERYSLERYSLDRSSLERYSTGRRPFGTKYFIDTFSLIFSFESLCPGRYFDRFNFIT